MNEMKPRVAFSSENDEYIRNHSIFRIFNSPLQVKVRIEHRRLSAKLSGAKEMPVYVGPLLTICSTTVCTYPNLSIYLYDSISS